MRKTITLHVGKPGSEVKASAFLKATQRLIELLTEVEKSFSETGRPALTWTVADLQPGSAIITLTAPAPAELGYTDLEVANAVLEGMVTLERSGVRPPRFSERAIEQAQEMASLLRKHTDGVNLQTTALICDVTTEMAANAGALLGTPYEELGMVVGELKMVRVDPTQFSVYDDVTGRAIKCVFAEDQLETVIGALDRRIAVYGLLGYASDGHLRTVRQISQIEVYPRDEELPTCDDVLAAGLEFDRDPSTGAIRKVTRYEH